MQRLWIQSIGVYVLLIFPLHSFDLAAQEKTAPKASVSEDPLEVLTKFIEKHDSQLRTMQDNGTPLKPEQAKQAEAILVACEKILADDDISDVLRIWTLKRKAYALTLLAYAEPKQYFGKLIAAADEYEEKGHSKFAKTLELHVLKVGTAILTAVKDPKDPKPLKLDFDVFVDRMLDFAKANPGSTSQLLVSELLAGIEKMPLGPNRDKMRLSVAETFSKHFLASADSFEANYGQELQGLARFLSAPGKPMFLEGTLLNGQPFEPETLAKKVVLVQFWEPRCVHCIEEMPVLAEMLEQYGKKGFMVVGVCTQGALKSVQKFVVDRGISWPVILDELAPKKHRLTEYYGFRTTPQLFLIGRDGNVVCVNPSIKSLPQEIEQALYPRIKATETPKE